MKRIMEDSPVKGYQLFRFVKRRPDGVEIVLPKYYVRHRAKDTRTGTDNLAKAKIAVKKQAGDDAQERRHRTAGPDTVTVGTLLDLVTEDYRVNDHKTLKHAAAQIEHGLRPFFGAMRADKVHTADIERWIAWAAKAPTAEVDGRQALCCEY